MRREMIIKGARIKNMGPGEGGVRMLWGVC